MIKSPLLEISTRSQLLFQRHDQESAAGDLDSRPAFVPLCLRFLVSYLRIQRPTFLSGLQSFQHLLYACCSCCSKLSIICLLHSLCVLLMIILLRTCTLTLPPALIYIGVLSRGCFPCVTCFLLPQECPPLAHMNIYARMCIVDMYI